MTCCAEMAAALKNGTLTPEQNHLPYCPFCGDVGIEPEELEEPK